MSDLISGKEAKVAWAEGVTVQVATGADQFRTLVSSDDLGIFDRGNYFRLKPHTVTINNIEVPAPFEPREGDDGHIIDLVVSRVLWDESDPETYRIGVWRTESEIEQVFAALRSVFNTK